MPVLCMGNKADAWPAILFNLSEIFHALQISREIFAFLLSSFFTDWIGFVNIINTTYFNFTGAFLIWDCGYKRCETKKG